MRKADHEPAGAVSFRHLWGRAKRTELLATAEGGAGTLYGNVEPVLPLGLPFTRTAVSAGWFEWPSLPDLFPVSFPGVKTSRDGFLVDVDIDRLRARVGDYFDEGLSHEEIARRYPGVMKTTARFDARSVRDSLLKRGGPNEAGFVASHTDPLTIAGCIGKRTRSSSTEKRADYRPHVFAGNICIEAREREAKESYSRGTLVRHLADNFGNGLSSYFPHGCTMTDLEAAVTERPILTCQLSRTAISTALASE